jgi:hypothetical protein
MLKKNAVRNKYRFVLMLRNHGIFVLVSCVLNLLLTSVTHLPPISHFVATSFREIKGKKKLKFDFLFDERKKDEKREGEREKIEI